MIKTNIAAMAVVGLSMLLVGCAAEPKQSGFLSTYENLEPVSSTRMRYIGPDVGNYSKFIINPVQTVAYDPAEMKDVKPEDIEHLQQYMYEAVSKAVGEKYEIVSDPGPGVATLRIAITNLKPSTPALNVIPQTKLTGLGLGQATVELEAVDSVTGKQLAAGIDSETGSRFSLSGLAKWGDVEAVMTDWAKLIRKRIDEAHGITS